MNASERRRAWDGFRTASFGFLVALAACEAPPSAPPQPQLAKGGNGGGNGGPGGGIPLVLSFDQALPGIVGDGDTDGDGMSDDYVHDVDDVLAQVAEDDNFQFEASTARHSQTRAARVVVDTPAGSSDQGFVDLRFQTKDLCPDNQFANCGPGEMDAAVGTMPVSTDTLRLILVAAWSEDGTDHSLRFGLGCESNVDRRPTERAYVTHAGADAWVVWGSDAVWCSKPSKGNGSWTAVSESAVAEFRFTLARVP